MKNLDDACDELLMVDDEDELVPFMVADVFFHTPLEETKVRRLSRRDGEYSFLGMAVVYLPDGCLRMWAASNYRYGTWELIFFIANNEVITLVAV